MAESGEEKNLPATPKRREEARKKGQVARSAEFSGAATLLALTLVLHATLPGVAGQSLVRSMQTIFVFNPHATDFSFGNAQHLQIQAVFWAARLLVPVMLLALVLGLVVNIGQVGLQITPEALAPKWERVNPLAGAKRLLSMHGTVEMLKGIAKMSIVGGICWTTVRASVDNGSLLSTMCMPLVSTLSIVGNLLWTLGLRVSITLLILAVADYFYQKYSFEKSLKMSFSEVKQEYKQSEGSPEVKARIRRLQREMSRRRMMQDVPKADVVVTNPTHYAVALQYEAGSPAPKVVAKGADEIAARIREIARESKVPLVENKPLARALHGTVEIGHFIPPDMFEAVAQVLAFVYRTYGRRKKA